MKINPIELAEFVREFRQYGYDPYNSHYEAGLDDASCVNYWWSVRQAIDRGEIDIPSS